MIAPFRYCVLECEIYFICSPHFDRTSDALSRPWPRAPDRLRTGIMLVGKSEPAGRGPLSAILAGCADATVTPGHKLGVPAPEGTRMLGLPAQMSRDVGGIEMRQRVVDGSPRLGQ